MKRMRSRLFLGTLLLLTAMAPWATAGEPVKAMGPPLAMMPGPNSPDMAGAPAIDGSFIIFRAVDGRLAWVSGLTGTGLPGTAGLVPRSRADGAKVFGPATLRIPGEPGPSVAWVEWHDTAARIWFTRQGDGPGDWAVPETVFPEPAEIVRFLDGAGSWLVWVEGRGRTDDIVACRRGPAGWARPVRLSLADESEDLAPSLAIDPNGDPWVVWAGTHSGKHDEILLNRMKDGAWAGETLVSREDDTPDVLPDLAIARSGLTCAAWLGYARETRDYRVTTAFSRDGATWTDEIMLGQGSFTCPPRLTLLDDGRFLLLWCDAAGGLWSATRIGDGWATPMRVAAAGGNDTAVKNASLLLIHRTNRPDGGLVAVPRPLP